MIDTVAVRDAREVSREMVVKLETACKFVQTPAMADFLVNVTQDAVDVSEALEALCADGADDAAEPAPIPAPLADRGRDGGFTRARFKFSPERFKRFAYARFDHMEDFAEVAGLNANTVSNWSTGRRTPYDATLKDVAKNLGMTFEEIIREVCEEVD